METVSLAHNLDRFPINVEKLALDTGSIFGWQDTVTEVRSADIKGFEGCLFPNENKTQWLILYNSKMKSNGRIRFTQAHELGHYLLHRQQKAFFECSNAADMYNVSKEDKDIEADADRFASYLLMPFDDYRKQIDSTINLDIFGSCADRYGVSLTATILRWLEYTEEKAVLIVSRNGFMNWAWSSTAAMKAGAFFRTKNNVIPIPPNSLTANELISQDRKGVDVIGKVWFQHAESKMTLREMKIQSEQFDSIITLLILPSVAEVWPAYA